MKRTPLKRSTKPLHKISKKRAIAQKLWNTIAKERYIERHGLCERCGQYGQLSGFNRIVGHHIRHRAGCPSRDTPDNCMILHWACHGIVHSEERFRVKGGVNGLSKDNV